MNRTGSNLLFLAVGMALGATVGYVAASDKKEEWLRDFNRLVDKVKGNISDAANKGKHSAGDKKQEGAKKLDELIDDAKQ